MNNEEADALAKIISTADGGCSVCVGGLTRQLVKAFPQHDWRVLVNAHGAEMTEEDMSPDWY